MRGLRKRSYMNLIAVWIGIVSRQSPGAGNIQSFICVSFEFVRIGDGRVVDYIEIRPGSAAQTQVIADLISDVVRSGIARIRRISKRPLREKQVSESAVRRQ